MAAAGAAPDGGCGGLVEVLKSPQDKKLYRYLRLDSGMSVLLISDPDINSSGADQDQQVCALRMGTMGCRCPCAMHSTLCQLPARWRLNVSAILDVWIQLGWYR